MNLEIKIGSCSVGPGFAPFIIAEMSGNHNQSIDRAFELVDAAAKAGAHAVKLQTYTADTMTLNLRSKGFVIEDPKSLWNGRTLYDLYQEAHTPWEWHKPIMDRCRKLGMEIFSTPFDETAVDFLQSLGVSAYKIASFENTDLRLIKKVASTGKPMIISTGMATVSEIDEAVRAAQQGGNKDLVLLKCTSTYPASPINTNVRTIPHMRDLFRCQIGLSDHTMGIGASVAAVAMGATIIEKHFTLRRSDGGPDSAFSLEPQELTSLVVETERAWQAMGGVTYGCSEVEKNSLQFRRSLYISRDLKKGDQISSENIKAVRPGFGLQTKFYDQLIGKIIKVDTVAGTPLSWDILY